MTVIPTPETSAPATRSLTEEQEAFLQLAKRLEEKAESIPHFGPGRTPLAVAASSLRNYVAETL